MHERNRRFAVAVAIVCLYGAAMAVMLDNWPAAIGQFVTALLALSYWRWNLYWWGKAVCPPAPVRPKRMMEALAALSWSGRAPKAWEPLPGPHPLYYGVRCDTCDEVTFVGPAPHGEGYVAEVVCDWCGATTETRADNIWWTDSGPEARSRMKH